MNDENKRRHIAPENKRDTTADKKKIKKALIVIVCIFLALGVLLGVLALVTELLKPEPNDYSYEDFRFFEADYSRNLYEDKLYMSLNRNIYYDRYGSENILTESNAEDIAPAAGFFYSYINCIIDGDYESYPDYFTQNCLNADGFKLPERFTMQGLYDIHIKLHSVSAPDAENSNLSCEVYEVSYRIYENNGTFRNDILPDETRTLVFELYIDNGTVKINSIGNRANG